jgi:outer membrane protein assembly factor BamE
MNTDTASIETREPGDRPRTRTARTALICLALSATLIGAGCASRDTSRSGLLEPYRTDLPQGNYLTREQVDQVHPGMSQDQVRFILGTPLLGHVFHTDRWDYVFMFKHPSGRTELRRVTVHFDKDQVASIDADPLPLREDASDPALPGYKPGAGGTAAAPVPSGKADAAAEIEAGKSRVEGEPGR